MHREKQFIVCNYSMKKQGAMTDGHRGVIAQPFRQKPIALRIVRWKAQ